MIVGPVCLRSLVNVVEPVGIRGESEAAKIPLRKSVRQDRACLNIEELKPSGTLSPMFNFIKQQAAIGRKAKQFHCCVRPCTPMRRVDEYLIRSVRAFPTAYAVLLLPGQTFPEEVSIAAFL